MKLVLDRRDDVLEFVTSRIRYPLRYENVIFEALGAEDKDGNLRAGALFHWHKPLIGGLDLEVNMAADPGWCTRSLLRAGCLIVFGHFKALRITATIARSNKKSRKLAETFGFQMVGPLKWGLGYKRNAVLYGLTFEDCRWLTEQDKTLIRTNLKGIEHGVPVASQTSVTV